MKTFLFAGIALAFAISLTALNDQSADPKLITDGVAKHTMRPLFTSTASHAIEQKTIDSIAGSTVIKLDIEADPTDCEINVAITEFAQPASALTTEQQVLIDKYSDTMTQLSERVHTIETRKLMLTTESRLITALDLDESTRPFLKDLVASYSEQINEINKRVTASHADNNGRAPQAVLNAINDDYETLREDVQSQLMSLASEPTKVAAAMNYLPRASIYPRKLTRCRKVILDS